MIAVPQLAVAVLVVAGLGRDLVVAELVAVAAELAALDLDALAGHRGVPSKY